MLFAAHNTTPQDVHSVRETQKPKSNQTSGMKSMASITDAAMMHVPRHRLQHPEGGVKGLLVKLAVVPAQEQHKNPVGSQGSSEPAQRATGIHTIPSAKMGSG